MAIIIPSPSEKIANWFKGVKNRLLGQRAKATVPNIMDPETDPSKVIWSHKLSKIHWVEAIVRDDGMMTFREMKRVKDGPYTFDIPLFESGLYNDRKEIVEAVMAHLAIAEGRAL